MRLNATRKLALLLGAGWTVAAAVALAWFKSSAFEPIYLWSLGAVASGWAGVLLHACASERRALEGSLAAAGCESRDMIAGLAQVMGVEVRWMCGELVRVDELLAHAIEQLIAAFNGLSAQTRAHQGGLAPAAAGSSASDVNGAVTALQFRDVVGQKLDHVRRELEALEQVLLRMREACNALPAAAPAAARAPGQMDLAARVLGLLRELERAKAASPAQQELMHAGEIELF